MSKIKKQINSKPGKLFIGGLSQYHTESKLSKYCSQWGKLRSCFIKRFPNGVSRGFGFVTFRNISDMENFLESEPHKIDDKIVSFKKAFDSKAKENEDLISSDLKNIFIGNLPQSTTKDEIAYYFGSYGKIRSISMPKQTKMSKKYAIGMSFEIYRIFVNSNKKTIGYWLSLPTDLIMNLYISSCD